MKITSRNVNWIRAVLNKWFCEWVQKDDPDILCLQETKAFENQIPVELKYALRDYDYIWHTGTRPGYAWTTIFYKKNLKIISTKNTFEKFPKFNEDGRVVELTFKYNDTEIVLLNIYFPNGWTRADWTEMLTYKLGFYEDVIKYINSNRDEWKEIIVTWDFNICHEPIDIARPEENANSIWFLPIERAEMDKLQKNWYTDVFRHLNPELANKYTWWSYRAWARPRNIWRRLDYFRASEWILKSVKNMEHQEFILWSDHCPISLFL